MSLNDHVLYRITYKFIILKVFPENSELFDRIDLYPRHTTGRE